MFCRCQNACRVCVKMLLEARDAIIRRLLRVTDASPKLPHDYSSTQANLEGRVKAAVLRVAASVPDSQLAEDGREDNPHITVKYGLHTDNAEDVRRLLAKQPPIKAMLGKLSLFRSPECAVIKFDVDSPDLHALNALMNKLPHTDTHDGYIPHVTVAYVKPGAGDRYEGLNVEVVTGMEIPIRVIAFSDRYRKQTMIPLRAYGAGESGWAAR